MRFTTHKLLISAVLALTVFSAITFGQTGGVSGRVVDANKAGIPGGVVAAESINVRFQRQTVSDDNGNYSLDGLPAGRYRITATARTFGSASTEIEVLSVEKLTLQLDPAAIAVEVSVTSSFLAGTPESLDEIPGSIDRIDAFTLENSRVFNFSEALRKIPGINVRDEEGFGLRPNIGIRGTNPTRSTKVLLLEDGMPLAYAPYGDNASYYHPPIERYESVEVLKGSSQIAYGPQTVAGVINYLTPNPTEKPTFALKLTGGNRSFFDGSFTGSGTKGRTGIFANYTRKQGDGARDNVNSKLNDFSTKIVRTLNERNALTFKFSYYGEDSNITYSGLTLAEYLAGPRSNVFKNDFFYGGRFGFSTSYTTIFSPSASLTTNAYANYFSRDWWRQSSNSGQRPNRLNIDPDCLSMADLNTTCGIEGRLRKYETYGIEPRFTYNYDAGTIFRGELQSGFRLHWEKQDRRQENGDLPASRSGPASEINIRRNFATSGYVQNRFVFGDLSVTPGVRLERIDIERENRLTTPFLAGKTTVNAVIPGIGVAYSGLARTTVFAGVHRGFSPPRAEDVVGNNGGVVELDPEQSWNYEFGARTTPVTGLRLEGTIFRLDYENQIVAASLAGGVGSTLTNGGRTRQQGIEFSGQIDSGAILRSSHNLYFRTAFTWLPAAEFRGVRFSSIIPAVSITGNRLPYTPETLVTYSFGYAHPKGINAFVENVYIGAQFSDDLNTQNSTANGQRGVIGAQSYWNATLNYSVERIKTTFFITAKNLTDRIFIVDRSRGILPSSGRLAQAGVKIRF